MATTATPQVPNDKGTLPAASNNKINNNNNNIDKSNDGEDKKENTLPPPPPNFPKKNRRCCHHQCLSPTILVIVVSAAAHKAYHPPHLLKSNAQHPPTLRTPPNFQGSGTSQSQFFALLPDPGRSLLTRSTILLF